MDSTPFPTGDQPLPSSGKQPCHATRKDGERCGAMARPDSLWCFAHDPQLAEQRSEARKQGGRNRSNVVRLQGLCPPRLQGVYDQLEKALGEVHDGTLDYRQAGAMANLARSMVAVLTSGELEERLRQLEGKRR